MAGCREHGHVDADLGEDVLRGTGLDPAQRAQDVNCALKRAQLFLDCVREPFDLLVEEVQVREDRSDQQRVQRLEATLERLAQRRELGSQPALREVGEHLGVGGALAERVEHRPAGDAEDVARDAVELDPGVLQRLVQPVGFALALFDLRLAIPGQLPQRPDRLGRHEARPQKPSFKQLAQPLGILDVGLAPGKLLDVASVDQQQARSCPPAPPTPASSTRRWPPSPPA